MYENAVIGVDGLAVAIAPAGYADRPGRIRKIGVAYDGSGQSEVGARPCGAPHGSDGGELVIRDVVGPHV